MHQYTPSTDATRPTLNRDDARSNRMFKWLIKQFSGDDDDLESLGSERGLEAFLDALPITQPAVAVEVLSEQFERAHTLELAPESDSAKRKIEELR